MPISSLKILEKYSASPKPASKAIFFTLTTPCSIKKIACDRRRSRRYCVKGTPFFFLKSAERYLLPYPSCAASAENRVFICGRNAAVRVRFPFYAELPSDQRGFSHGSMRFQL